MAQPSSDVSMVWFLGLTLLTQISHDQESRIGVDLIAVRMSLKGLKTEELLLVEHFITTVET